MSGTTDIDISDIRALLERARDAWNRGDGAAYGDCFTADAVDVTFVGTVYRGGPEIGRAHQALFDGFLKGTRMALEIVDVRVHGDSAVVVTRGEVAKRSPKRLGKVATYHLVRDGDADGDGDGDGWRIAAVQKTKRRPLMESVSFRLQPATRPA